MATRRRFDPLVELGQLGVECADAARQRGQRGLGGGSHRIGRAVGTEPFPFGDQCRHREALQTTTELLRRAVAEVTHLDQGLAPGLAGRTLGDDEDPDGLDRTVARLGLALRPTAQGGPGGFDGVEGIGLAGPSALLAIRSVDLDDLDTNSAQVAGKARAIRTGALDADLGDVAECLEPAQQRLVAGRVGGKALRAEQSTERIEGCGYMDVAVRVDTTGDPTRSFYDGHGHPFSQRVEGWHGRSGSERRAVWVVCCNPDHSPQLGDGTCRFQCAAGRLRPTTS